MHRFECPFCGPRDETEFRFGAEAGKRRPEPASTTTAGEWAEYLHFRSAPRGPAREIWVHLTCGEFFMMERNTQTHVVSGARRLGGASS